MVPTPLPILAQYVQALGPTFVAIVAAVIASVIAWRQWKTAQAKVLLDLFERRMALSIEVRDAVNEVLHSRKDRSRDDLAITMDYMRSLRKSQFLFGPEIQNYLTDLQVVLFQYCGYRLYIAEGGTPSDEDIRSANESADKLRDSFRDFPKVIAPYVNMHQKLS